MTMSGVEIPTSALGSVGRFRAVRALAWLLMLSLVAAPFVLVFTPWQQSVHGAGRVIAYAPLERRQAVEAPIEGRVVHWYVQEGDTVAAGDPIADLADNDPDILDRMRRERDAARAQVDAIALSISLTEARIASLRAAREAAVVNAEQRVLKASSAIDAAERAVDAAEATLTTAELNLDRQRSLHEKGLNSEREYELSLLEAERARTELDRARASLTMAEAEVRALSASRGNVASTNDADIESTRATLEKLKGDQAKAVTELTQVEVKLARQEQMQVVAPRAGVILRLLAKQGSEMVKSGDPLVQLVPNARARAVELYVGGNDTPLIESGREVRIQFEGWPAVQFVGWPSAAVGTFGGQVAFVDAHGDLDGRFRVVVLPNEGEHWPDERYLRQGVRANGWILLDEVSIGFELWRQFNGFPPALMSQQKEDAAHADEVAK